MDDVRAAAAERYRRYREWVRNHYMPSGANPYRDPAQPNGDDCDQRQSDQVALADAYVALSTPADAAGLDLDRLRALAEDMAKLPPLGQQNSYRADVQDTFYKTFTADQILALIALVRRSRDAERELENALKSLVVVATHRHTNVLVSEEPRTPRPEGWNEQRWRKHWDNCRRAEQMTSVAPITAEGWEKVAVMLMDQTDQIGTALAALTAPGDDGAKVCSMCADRLAHGERLLHRSCVAALSPDSPPPVPAEVVAAARTVLAVWSDIRWQPSQTEAAAVLVARHVLGGGTKWL
jgi:hypothetical protein